MTWNQASNIGARLLVRAAIHEASYVYVDVNRRVIVAWDGGPRMVAYDLETWAMRDEWRTAATDKWSAREAAEKWLVHSTTYPRKNARGETVWACCESAIGPVCGHRSGLGGLQ